MFKCVVAWTNITDPSRKQNILTGNSVLAINKLYNDFTG